LPGEDFWLTLSGLRGRSFRVVDGDRIVGLVDESDMLGAVLEGSALAFDLPVKRSW
jgi:hypothetical protein